VAVGDVGYVDDDGYLFLTDRRHNMIISGGVNIHPQEAEHILVSHPLVVDAAVFGIPDDELGQSVKAFVELADPSSAGDEVAATLMSWLQDGLAKYKCPRSISHEERLPRTDAGKLYKQGLIDKYSAC
jgi:long-chain acyl-CoA synthetase